MAAVEFQKIWGGEAFIQFHCNTMVVYNARQEKVAELNAEEQIAALVETPGGSIYTFGGVGEVLLWDLQAKSCKRLRGPRNDIKGAAYLKQWGAVVCYGGEGEVFAFTGDKGDRLEGMTSDVEGILWVDAWQVLVAYGGSPANLDAWRRGSGEAATFAKPDAHGQLLQGLERFVSGAVWVDAWQALVAYGDQGAVVFAELGHRGQQLQGLTCDVKGTIWVDRWQALVAYGHVGEDFQGEALAFKAPGRPGQRLAGLTYGVQGAVWVDAWSMLLTLGRDPQMGNDGEAVAFAAPDQQGRQLEGLTSDVQGAIWVKAWGALVVYAKDNAIAFREPDVGGWQLEGLSKGDKGAVWVEAWQSLFVHCKVDWDESVPGEAVSFPAFGAEGQWLYGLKKSVTGAVWVDRWRKLVAYGVGSLVAFTQSQVSQGPEVDLQHALWVDKWEALVVVDCDGQAVAFQADDKRVQLASPGQALGGVVWIDAWQKLVAHGRDVVVAFGEPGMPGQQLRGLDTEMTDWAVCWVDSWGELAAHSYKGVLAFASPDTQPRPLTGLHGVGKAAVWVDAWQALVACGTGGVFAFDRRGHQLDFAREEWEFAEGALWVSAWQELVVFGHGKVCAFSTPDATGRKLGDLSHVHGAVWVDDWQALVAYGWEGAGAGVFTLQGQRRGLLQAVSDMNVRGVVYADDLGMLVVYGERAAVAFPTMTHEGISLLPENTPEVMDVLSVSGGVAIAAGKDLWLIKPGHGKELAAYLVRHDAPVRTVVVRRGAQPTWLVSRGAKETCELISLCNAEVATAIITDVTLFAHGFVGSTPYKKSTSGKKLDLPKKYALDVTLLTFTAQGVSVMIGIGQMLGFAFHGVKQPLALQAPAHLLQRLQDFGVTAKVLSEANCVFLGFGFVVTTVLVLAFILQEVIERNAFLNPKQELWSLMYDMAGMGTSVIAGPVFLPLLKVLIWPLAAASSDLGVWLVLVARPLSFVLSVALVLVCYRFVRVDNELRRIDAAGWRFFTWQHDRVPTESDRLASRKHPLSLKDTWHGRIKIIAKVLLTLSQGVAGVAPLADATFRVFVGFVLATNDMLLDEYFPGRDIDWNRCAAAASSGLAASYCASLVTVLVGKWPHGMETYAPLIILLNVMVVPFAAAGYLLRPILNEAKSIQPLFQRSLRTPLLENEV